MTRLAVAGMGYGAAMAEQSSSTPGLGDLLALFGNNNPITGITKSLGQFQRSVNQFMDSVDRMNDMMEQMSEVAKRVTALIDLVEPPLRAAVPQMTRTLKAADAMVEQLSGPVERMAPTMTRFAETMSNPTLLSFPNQLGSVLEMLTDLAKRLQPLGQVADTAGSLFGFRALPNPFGATPPSKPAQASAPPPPEPQPAAPAKKAAPKKAKSAAKKSAKKSSGKKAASTVSRPRPVTHER